MIKSFLPTSLLSRFILIIVLPTIFTQLIATYMFYNRHWYSVSKNMMHSLANDIKVVNELFNLKESATEEKKLINYLHIGVTSMPRNKQRSENSYPSETEILHSLLSRYFKVPVQISFIDDNDSIKIDVFQKDRVISFVTNKKRVDNPTTYIFILWMTGTSLIFLLFSIIFTKNQIRPIIKLARAADKFGKGQNISLKPEGATEIRKASVAFLKMKERIERQISNRTEMLAGVSHDLRTPLTRIKLQLAISEDPEISHILDDIRDMEYLINSYLDFARGDMKENVETVNFSKFLSQILDNYASKDLEFQKIPSLKIALKTDSIKRCFHNLMDNAFKYGSKVIVKTYISEGELYIEIHDNGSGIPKEKREDVFKPFFRIEESRNKDTGGVGLGLAITKDIISNHGGQIYLDTSELLKGLKVIIALPL